MNIIKTSCFILFCLCLICAAVGCQSEEKSTDTQTTVSTASTPTIETNSTPSQGSTPDQETVSTPESAVTEAPSQPSSNPPSTTVSIPRAYIDLLKVYIDAFPWQGYIPELEDASMMYVYHNSLDQVGYYLVDVDGNGQQELFLGKGEEIYDAYTLVNGRAVHLFNSGERYQYSYCSDGSFYFTGSNGAGNSETARYTLSGDTLVLSEMVVFDHFYAVELGLTELNNLSNSSFSTKTGEKSDYVPLDDATATAKETAWRNKVITPSYQPLSKFQTN